MVWTRSLKPLKKWQKSLHGHKLGHWIHTKEKKVRFEVSSTNFIHAQDEYDDSKKPQAKKIKVINSAKVGLKTSDMRGGKQIQVTLACKVISFLLALPSLNFLT